MLSAGYHTPLNESTDTFNIMFFDDPAAWAKFGGECYISQ
jgi:hypothetical protein